MEGRQSKVKVWLNGTFDVLHMGHIKLIIKAKELAGEDSYIKIGVDTDERIKLKKGKDRPINTLKHRVEFLENIKYVDEVVTFNTDDELINHICDFKPDYMVIGDDYKDKEIIGKKCINKIHYLPRYGNLSTTNILNIKTLQNRNI